MTNEMDAPFKMGCVSAKKRRRQAMRRALPGCNSRRAARGPHEVRLARLTACPSARCGGRGGNGAGYSRGSDLPAGVLRHVSGGLGFPSGPPPTGPDSLVAAGRRYHGRKWAVPAVPPAGRTAGRLDHGPEGRWARSYSSGCRRW